MRGTLASMGSGIDSARAWKVAVAAAITNGVAFGTVYTFGTFFEAMASEFGTGLGPTSVVFSITLFLFLGTGAASGFLADRYGPRPLVWVGGLLFSGGLFLTSQVDQLWHGYLTYGVGAGLGGGLFVSPLFAAVAGWFDRYRAIGQGVAATGNGLGTLILLPLANRLIETDGWRHAYVTLAVISAVTFAIGGLLLDRPPIERPPRAGRHLRAVLATTSFRRLAIGGALATAGQSSAFAFTVLFATDAGVSSARAALLIGIVGASSIIGRLLLTGLSDRVGSVRMLQACLLVQPLAFFLLAIAGANYTVLVAYAVLLGLGYGGFVALIGQVSAHLFGVRGLGVVLGWVYLSAAVGSLLYPPVVGFLADATSTGDVSTSIVPKLAIAGVSFVGSLYLLRLSPDPVPTETLEATLEPAAVD
ncbi:MAG: MFS transporter [Actinomycetia bacterium]|nr:MFS transporter [Actinomycetes bacterium]